MLSRIALPEGWFWNVGQWVHARCLASSAFLTNAAKNSQFSPRKAGVYCFTGGKGLLDGSGGNWRESEAHLEFRSIREPGAWLEKLNLLELFCLRISSFGFRPNLLNHWF